MLSLYCEFEKLVWVIILISEHMMKFWDVVVSSCRFNLDVVFDFYSNLTSRMQLFTGCI